MRTCVIFLWFWLALPVAAQTSPAEVQQLQKAAEAGQVEAQARLGYNYEMGLGVGKSDKGAVYWYHRAGTSQRP